MRRSLLLCLLLPSAAFAATETPIYIVQQGRLLSADEKPVTTALQLTVTLYASKDENDAGWTDTFDVEFGSGGTYQLVLGTNKVLVPSDLNGRKYVGVSIGAQKLLPRLRIGTTPYAVLAADAERLGGNAATDYALKSDIPSKALDSEKLGGKDPTEYLLKTDLPSKAKDSEKLGGKEPTEFLLKTDLPAKAADSDKLGGKLPGDYLLKAELPAKAADSDKLGGIAATSLLDGAGKVLAAALPSSVPLLGSDNKLAPSLLAGPLSLSILPTGIAGTSAGLAVLDSSGKIPLAALPAISSSVSQTANGLAAGACVTLTHNFNTRAVFYQVWVNDSGTWSPMALAGRDAQTNIALGKACNSSSTYNSSYPCSNANDGNLSNGWHSVAGDGNGTITFNLGAITVIDRVRVAGHSYNTGWEVLVSTDGSSFTNSVGTGSCSIGGSCGTLVDTLFTPVSAQYVRIRDTGGDPTYSYFPEVEIYGASYPVTLPDVNTMKVCNYTGKARDFAIVVSK